MKAGCARANRVGLSEGPLIPYGIGRQPQDRGSEMDNPLLIKGALNHGATSSRLNWSRHDNGCHAGVAETATDTVNTSVRAVFRHSWQIRAVFAYDAT